MQTMLNVMKNRHSASSTASHVCSEIRLAINLKTNIMGQEIKSAASLLVTSPLRWWRISLTLAMSCNLSLDAELNIRIRKI